MGKMSTKSLTRSLLVLMLSTLIGTPAALADPGPPPVEDPPYYICAGVPDPVGYNCVVVG